MGWGRVDCEFISSFPSVNFPPPHSTMEVRCEPVTRVKAGNLFRRFRVPEPLHNEFLSVCIITTFFNTNFFCISLNWSRNLLVCCGPLIIIHQRYSRLANHAKGNPKDGITESTFVSSPLIQWFSDSNQWNLPKHSPESKSSESVSRDTN